MAKELLAPFDRVYETHVYPDSVVIIVPAVSGHHKRYHTLRILLKTGKTIRIGCELPLSLARKVAKRPTVEDGTSLKK